MSKPKGKEGIEVGQEFFYRSDASSSPFWRHFRVTHMADPRHSDSLVIAEVNTRHGTMQEGFPYHPDNLRAQFYRKPLPLNRGLSKLMVTLGRLKGQENFADDLNERLFSLEV